MSPADSIVVVLSIVFPIIVLSNVVLAIMIVKMKRGKEHKAFEKKRHVDVLHVSVACVDVLGSCVIYPTLIYLHHKAGKRKDMNDDICTFLGSAAAFYVSCIVNLTTAINIHGLYSSIWPLKFFVYLRRKNSKIPFVCVAVSLLIGLVSLILSACGYRPFYRLKSGHSLNETACVPELQDSAVIYYYVVVAHLSYWVNIAAFISLLVRSIKREVKWRKRSTGLKEDFCGLLPRGSCFQLSYRLMFFVAWTPFVVVITMVMSGHDVSSDVILTSCYVMFIPALLSPFVFYATHHDVRSVFHSSLEPLHSKIKCRRRNEKTDVGIDNQGAIELENR